MKKPFFLQAVIIFILVVFSFLFITGTNKTDRLISALIMQDERLLEENNTLIEKINHNKTLISFLIKDPQSKKIAQKIQPEEAMIAHYTNRIDDYFLTELNAFITYSNNKSNWFNKDRNTQQAFCEKLENLKYPENHKKSSDFFNKDYFKRANIFRSKMIEYRNDILIYLYNNCIDQNKRLNQKKLESRNEFDKFLNKTDNNTKTKLENIYIILTKPEMCLTKNSKKTSFVNWGESRFKDQPLIGVIGTFTSLRNDIRKAQLLSTKILMDKINESSINNLNDMNGTK